LASAKPSLWRRLFGKPPVPPSLPAPTVEPQHLGSADEVFLAKLVADLAEGKRRDQIGDAQVVHHLDGLWTSGHERLAIEWMEKLLSVPEVPVAATAALRAVLVERYEQRGELDTALAHLDGLTRDARYALRAHYLLAEHARKHGDHERALRHYEAVLGHDVDYPNVRMRVERQPGQPPGHALAVAAAHAELLAVLHDHHLVAAEPGLQFLHGIESDDHAPVNAHELFRVEA